MHSMSSSNSCLLLVLCVLGGGWRGAEADHESFHGQDVHGQILTNTQGTCGSFCYEGNYWKCASSAICVNHTCMCPFGFVGHPELYCTPFFSWYTMVFGDPKVKLYDGTTAHLNLPCRTHLTRIVTEHNLGVAGGNCDIQISTLVHHLEHGYYLLGVDFDLIVTDYAHPHAVRQFIVRIYGYGTHGVYTYKEQWRDIDGDTRAHRKHPEELEYMATMLQTRFDYQDNLAMIESTACGAWLTFKAHVKYTGQLPGMIFFVSKHVNAQFPNHDTQLSGSPTSDKESKLMYLKRKLNLDKAQSALYISLENQAEQDFGIPAISCIMALKEFKTMCRTKIDKVFAIKVCSPLFITRNVSRCLQAGEFGQNIASVFALCAQALCLEHTFLCQEVKRELETYNCQLPPFFRDLDCTKISEAMTSYYPNAPPGL